MIMEKITVDDDLRTRPLHVLCQGHVMSYNHNVEREPIVDEIVIRYNKKKYTLFVQKIEVKPVGDTTV